MDGRERRRETSATHPRRPGSGDVPSSDSWETGQERLQEQKGNLGLPPDRLPWVRPPPPGSRISPERLGPRRPVSARKVPSGPEMHGRCPLSVSRSPSPSRRNRTSPASALGFGSFQLSRPVAFSFWPTPTPIRRTRKRRAFSGSFHSALRTFRSERAIPLANRKPGRAWRERRNERVQAAREDRMQINV